MQQTIARGYPLQSLFNTTDERFHARLRRAVANAYAMSTLINFEPLVDSTTNEFLKQLSHRYADRKGSLAICDFGAWLQYYAFDVIGELTYSKRLGFLDRGIDVDRIISNLEWLLDYVSIVRFYIHLWDSRSSPPAFFCLLSACCLSRFGNAYVHKELMT